MLSCFSRVWLFVTPWTVAHQAPLSILCPMQEYWSGLSWSAPEDLLNPEIRPRSPALAGRFFPTELPGKPIPTLYLLLLLLLSRFRHV